MPNRSKLRGSALIPVVVGGAVLPFVLGFSFGFKLPFSLFQKKQVQTTQTVQEQKTTKLPSTTQEEREKGNAGEYYPYAKTDDSKTAVMPLSGDGGSFSVTLSKQVKLYIIYPENIAEGTELIVTPYFSMPTASTAPALSAAYGYGADIQFPQSRHGELPATMYAVFDLDQGKTISQIQKDPKKAYFCDPSIETFNPAACAWLNKVPLNEHTHRTFAAVSPIRTENLTHLLSMEPTIPIGYDNLLVVQLQNERTLIPQKLSRDLLVDLIKANGLSSETTIYRLEAATKVVQEKLYRPDDMSGLGRAFYGSTPYEQIKVYYTLPEYQSFFQRAKQGNVTAVNEKAFSDKIKELNADYDFASDIERNKQYIHSDVKGLFGDVNRPSQLITGAAFIRRLEEAGFDMLDARQRFAEKLTEDFDYFYEDDYGYVADMLIAAALLSDKTTAFHFPVKQIQAQEEPPKMSPQEIQKLIDEYLAKANNLINTVCGDDSAQPPKEIVRAMKVAQLIGNMGASEKCQQKMCKQLDAQHGSERSVSAVYKDLTLDQAMCDDPDGKRTQKYIEELGQAFTKLQCETLMEKNLKTFAWNELKCREFQDEDGSINGKKFPTLEELKERMREKQKAYEARQR